MSESERLDAERANEAVLATPPTPWSGASPLARLRLERSLAHRARSVSKRDGQPSVEPYVRHVRRFGDPRTVFEAALQDDRLGASELAYLAARLRRVKISQAADHFSRGRGGAHRPIKWPGFTLREHEREALTRALIDAGTPEPKIVNLLGTTRQYIEAVRSDMEAETRAREFGGGVDLSTVDRETFEAIVGVNPGLGSKARGRLSSKRSLGPNSRVGRLTVVGPDRGRSRYLVCRCDCGSEKSIRRDKLGKTQSCGCLRRDRAAGMKRRSFTAVDGGEPIEPTDLGRVRHKEAS